MITLTIRYRDIGSKAPQILGSARMHLADVVQAPNFTSQQQWPVTTIQNQIIIGRLLVKLELGCRGVHFGGDFLEAISSNASTGAENRNRELYSSFPIHSEHFRSYQKYDWNDAAIDDWFDYNCPYDIHDEQTDDKYGSASRPLNIEPKSSKGQKANGKNDGHHADDLSDKELSHGLNQLEDRTDDGGDELKGLFHIGQINYCSWYQATSETFLVCRPFWVDSALVTDNCQNQMQEDNFHLNYLEVFSFSHKTHPSNLSSIDFSVVIFCDM